LALEQVYRTRKAYISNKVIPVMCLPIFEAGTMRGAFYLDAIPGRFPQFRFQAEHLEIAGAFVENLESALRMNRKFEGVKNERDLLREMREIQRPIIGKSKAIQGVLQDIAKAAAFDSTVLILGETGTGKELVAQAIHQLSSREDKPFVAVNCGGIPESLLQSELCGHAKGAFTGAVTARKGKFRQAESGTVFLDEMGELAMGLQAALLRVLQEKKVDVVGEDKPVDVDVRIIAATNVDLERAVEDSRFRRDLYYRLKVIVIHLPSLRERPEDIPLLTDYFVKKYRRDDSEITIAPEAMTALLSYPWPGNVRELENAIQSAIVQIYRTSDVIALDALPQCIRTPKAAQVGLPKGGVVQQSRDTADAVIAAALKRRYKENGGNVREAAAHVGIGKTKAYELMKEDL
jgi:transcriptional regulator with PAS, ATPase and Fis domain